MFEYQRIIEAAAKGVAKGYPDGTFKPFQNVKRSEFATLVMRYLNPANGAQSDTPFSDVPKSHWASGYIAAAVEQNVVHGYSDGTFHPDASITG